jgi:hypothetical protein
MAPHPSVLLALRHERPEDRVLGEHMAAWVAGLGFRPLAAADAAEALARLAAEPLAASFLDSDLGAERGTGDGALWRRLPARCGRPIVLVARARATSLWAAALTAGIAAVLPWPPERRLVAAALAAACGPLPWQAAAGADPTSSPLPSTATY